MEKLKDYAHRLLCLVILVVFGILAIGGIFFQVIAELYYAFTW